MEMPYIQIRIWDAEWERFSLARVECLINDFRPPEQNRTEQNSTI